MGERRDQQSVVRSRVAFLRVSHGLYQHELAQAIGISVDSLRRFESGDVVTAPLWWYANAAIALNVDLSELLTAEQRAWHPRPQTPAAPGADWLGAREHLERAAAWLAEAEDWPGSRYDGAGAIY
jgi:transcriptional regulator with XRE-family HTH domain